MPDLFALPCTMHQGALTAVRISEDRYTRDRARHDLVMRFMLHEARMQTIRNWTGLSRDRILNLYRSYRTDLPAHVTRPSGKSPVQASFFVRTPSVRMEASVLASMFILFDVTPADGTVNWDLRLPDVALGERLCQAFEQLLAVHPRPELTFEHAVLLLSELARRSELRLGGCKTCDGLVVIDCLNPRDEAICGRCSGCSST